MKINETIRKVGSNGSAGRGLQFTIPIHMVDSLHIKKGDQLKVSLYMGETEGDYIKLEKI
ncbi:MAG: hypothetical protein BZ134_00140 [Methanosphaera sp. SHI1033]|nr:MAG: hypothetical protein BZ134_00140 [Methanosphaera sp. SHI1033]